MTTTLRSLTGIVFAALLAMSLVATTVDALAYSGERSGLPALFDEGFVDRPSTIGILRPRPIGRLGVTWE